ncbi:hypothetical protein BDP27DRAFT_1427834 [Rhodocollybia butyracea]|uniref:Uncharacterized protein n=1 Tax=Rhodocollybia butyracea TaxID=206335 RepID=A0A9P5U143_9AGAR|nr:hypothetical protein BDP27DRAFT_1427834 [Rhodocollybia butyracea]
MSIFRCNRHISDVVETGQLQRPTATWAKDLQEKNIHAKRLAELEACRAVAVEHYRQKDPSRKVLHKFVVVKLSYTVLRSKKDAIMATKNLLQTVLGLGGEGDMVTILDNLSLSA